NRTDQVVRQRTWGLGSLDGDEDRRRLETADPDRQHATRARQVFDGFEQQDVLTRLIEGDAGDAHLDHGNSYRPGVVPCYVRRSTAGIGSSFVSSHGS